VYFDGKHFSNTSEQMWDASWGDRGEVCAGGLSDSYFPGNFQGKTTDHYGIGGFLGPYYQPNRGHFVTMLRQPEQRLISHYYYFGPVALFGFGGHALERSWPYATTSPSLREYAEFSAGCGVRQMIMADEPWPCVTLPLPTSKEVGVAIDMLQDGFAFVGITEQWALSVCLFRTMFGGQCVTSDFANTRPGDNSSSSAYDTSELYGWVDPIDGPLYAEALLMFESTRSVYGVDSRSCSSMCQGQSEW